MGNDPTEVLHQCFRAILRPAARFALKNSLPLKTIIENVKMVFIELAAEELEKKGEKVNVSRITVATGLYRRDVARIYREKEVKDPAPHFIGKIIDRWRRDRRFITDGKRPRVLSLDGDDCEFNKLVRAVTVDVHPKAVLVELKRVGAVEESRDGAKLTTWGYIPRKNIEQGVRYLGSDSEDLVNTITDNLFAKGARPPHFQVITSFDNVDAKDLVQLEKWLHRECRRFQRKMGDYMAKFDLDLHPDPEKKGKNRIALGIFTHSKKAP